MNGSSGALTTTGIPSSLGLSTDGILYSGTGLILTGLSDDVGDDGGWGITATGLFPTTLGVYVWARVPRGYYGTLTNEPMYSGVQAKDPSDKTVAGGAVCFSTDGITLKFVVPPLPEGGPYDLYLETTDAALTYTATGVLTVVHRTHTDRKYKVRSSWPPPRDVGPYDISGEDYDG